MNFNIKICEIKNYKSEFLSNDKIFFKKHSDLLLNEKFTLGYDIFGTRMFDKKNIQNFNWEFTPNVLQNTYELYLYGLRHIYILSKAYEIENNIEYLTTAIDFFDSYLSFISNIKNGSAMINNDHVISERIENITYFTYVCFKYKKLSGRLKDLKEFVNNEIKKLESDLFYQKNHNHGIIADKSVLIGLNFFKMQDLKKRNNYIINRLKNQINHSLFPDGVHKENSYDYHISILRMFISIQSILKLINHDYYNVFNQKIESMVQFIVFALKPDLSKPLLGDTQGTTNICQNINIDTFGNSNLIFLNSRGKNGEKPSINMKHFKQSGYVFYRSSFNQQKINQTSWLSFKAGFVTRTHKHKDDLSVCWYNNGQEILVDSGVTTYMYGESLKNYMESVPAHNVPGITGETYSIASNNGELTAILKAEDLSDYLYMLGYSKLYEGTIIYRQIYYIKHNDVLIVRDYFHSSQRKEFTQYFNLSPKFKLDKESKIKLSESNLYLNVLNIDSKIKTSFSDSYYSNGFGKHESKLSFTKSQKMKKGYIQTILALEELNHPICSSNEFDFDKTGFTVKNNQIKFKKIDVFKFIFPKIKIINTNIIIENKKTRRHALYLYNYKTKQNVEKFPLVKDTIVYNNVNNDPLILLYYMEDDLGVKEKGIIGTVINNKFKKNNKNLKPVIKKAFVTKKSGYNEYNFKVDINYIYDNNLTFTWWVYFNGSGILNTSNKNKEFSYKMEKEGTYVIIVSVRDRLFGEFFFKTFEKIEII